ncbi:MAG: hypothetical protein GXX96_29495 [Planctomycetaceae bacterium]|nr:hypothetical protein [Planctomycetaceae bacterium]
MDEQAAYLADAAFHEVHTGPVLVDDSGIPHGRDPDERQIRDMCAAILKSYPRPMVGHDPAPCAIPIVSELALGVFSRDTAL